jgi:putative transposase
MMLTSGVNILDEVLQMRRNITAAKHLLTRLIKKQGMPHKRIITDRFGSYSAA